jgi:hypothetical protein
VGLSKTFPLGAEERYGRISLGFSALFGDMKTAPALTLRYNYERGRFASDLSVVQALSETNAGVSEEEEFSNRYDNISDGNHVSYRVTPPLLLGFTWEHIQFRHDPEWKYGVRAAYRLKPGWEVTAFVLVPETELRLGASFK